MRKVILFLLFFLQISLLVAQSVLTKSQLFTNPEWDNPSMAGMSDQLKLGILYKQSINTNNNNISYIESGIFLPISSTFNRETDNSAFILSNPSLNNQTDNLNKSIRKKHGIGFNVSNFTLNDFQRTKLKLSYAYHLPISKNLNMSFGTGFSYLQSKFNLTNFTVEDPQNDLFYQNIINSGFSGNQITTDIGISLYSQKFYLTTTVSNILINEGGNLSNTEGASILQPSVSGGYKIGIGQFFHLIPQFNYRINKQFDNQLNYNLRLNYKNILYAGLGGENNRKIAILFGIKLPKAIFLDYAYDHYMDYGQILAKGVHEISLTYIFNNKKLLAPFIW